MNSWCERCARNNNCYVMDTRPKCFVVITNTAHGTPQNYLVKTPQKSRNSHEVDTPQTEEYDFRDEQEYNDRWQTDCAWK